MIDGNSLPSTEKTPDTGLVLGIDVGCSPTRRSTCFCTLTWDATSIRLQFRLTTSDQEEHHRALQELVAAAIVDGVAIDGPLTNGFRLVRNYRSAEAILSRGVLQKRGKPGQTSVPVGQNLHTHATRLAETVLGTIHVMPARHPEAICERCIVEAFPNIYLAALVDEARIPALRRNASDVYWDLLVKESDVLAQHFQRLLPGRALACELPSIRNHDHRAGVVCALTALSVVLNRYVAVGDAADGDIILPDESHWGPGLESEAWLTPVLRGNLAGFVAQRREAMSCARIRTGLRVW